MIVFLLTISLIVLSGFSDCGFNINDEVLFGISWKSGDSLVKEDIGRAVTIHSKDRSESFRCVVPHGVKDKYDSGSSDDYQGPSERELLQPLFGNKLCSVKIESYWTYEICHGRHVRQFHEETVQGKSSTLQQYHLGIFNNQEKENSGQSSTMNSPSPAGKSKQLPTITINSVNFPYYKVNMTNGTKCDLLGMSRSINILYVCQTEGRGEIHEIQEIRTCEYQAIVFTKLLCSHPGYKVTDNLVNEIACYPLNSSPTVPKSLSLLHDEIKSEVNSISTLDGLFNDNFNMGSQIKVEAFKENGIIVYRIKTVGKENLKSEGNEDSEDISGNIEESESSSTPILEKGTPSAEKESVTQTKNPPETLKSPPDSGLLNRFISGKFCVDGGEGWWRHRVCYNRKITQYHVEMHIETSEIILGLWKQNNHLQWLKYNPDKKPLNEVNDRMEIYQYFSDGSYCDEIKANRDAILRIRCVKDNSSAILISFLEPTICSYIVTIESSLFCSMIKEADEFGLLKPKDE